MKENLKVEGLNGVIEILCQTLHKTIAVMYWSQQKIMMNSVWL